MKINKKEKEDLEFIYNHLNKSGFAKNRIQVLYRLINKPVETTNGQPKLCDCYYTKYCNSTNLEKGVECRDK